MNLAHLQRIVTFQTESKPLDIEAASRREDKRRQLAEARDLVKEETAALKCAQRWTERIEKRLADAQRALTALEAK